MPVTFGNILIWLIIGGRTGSFDGMLACPWCQCIDTVFRPVHFVAGRY